MTTLVNIPQNSAQKEPLINLNFQSVAPSGIFSQRNAGVSGLTWAYFGGDFPNEFGVITSVPDGTIALTASATNYIEYNTTTAAVQKTTTGFTAGFPRIAEIPTSATGIISASYKDRRIFAPLATGKSGNLKDSGLINFSDNVLTTTPNNTIYAAVLAAIGTTTNVDFVVNSKGSGAFIVGPPPDNTTVGGNKRGSNSVDIQPGTRTAANRVASGTNAVCLGIGNMAAGVNSFAIGENNQVQAGSSSSFAFGQFINISNTQLGFGFGRFLNIDANRVWAFGSQGSSKLMSSSFIFGASFDQSNQADGSAQVGLYPLRRVLTAANTDFVLTSDGSAPTITGANTNVLILKNNEMRDFEGTVVMRDIANAGAEASWKIDCVVSRKGTAASTAFVGTPTVSVRGMTALATTNGYACTVSINITTGALEVKCQYTAGGNARAAMRFITIENL